MCGPSLLSRQRLLPSRCHTILKRLFIQDLAIKSIYDANTLLNLTGEFWDDIDIPGLGYNFVCVCRVSNKPEKEISNEIQAILRQITASVSFLPLIESQCTFEMLMYTDKDAEVPVVLCIFISLFLSLLSIVYMHVCMHTFGGMEACKDMFGYNYK